MIRDVKQADAAGLTQLLLAVFEWADIDVKKKLVGFCADGVSVNMGRTGGVAVRLAREIPAPWLVVIHCVSHRIELAVKDTFKGTSADVVIDMLVSIFLLYDKSNKRQQIANATRWNSQVRMLRSLLAVNEQTMEQLNFMSNLNIPKTKVAKYVVRILAPFEWATDFIQVTY